MWFRRGVIVGIIATFPLSSLCALLFRFPIPFAGFMSGPKAVFPALLAVLFYGIPLGGFIIQALLGGLGGLIAEDLASEDKRDIKKHCIIYSTIGASVGVLAIAIFAKK